MKTNKLSSVVFVVAIITFLVVLDVSMLCCFIYCCIAIHHNIEEIIFWAIVMFSTFGTFNFLGVEMVKDVLSNN